VVFKCSFCSFTSNTFSSNGMCKYQKLLQCKGLQVCRTLHLVRKPKSCRAFTGSAAMPAHPTVMYFPANAGLIFLADKLSNDRYLVVTGATLSIIPCASCTSPSSPLLKRANGLRIPSWEFITKFAQFQGKVFTSSFLQAAGPVLDI
jgi:hypothetical protein